jgi:hypothetical protein
MKQRRRSRHHPQGSSQVDRVARGPRARRRAASVWSVALLLFASACGKPRLVGSPEVDSPGTGQPPPAPGGAAPPGFTLPPVSPPAAADAGDPPVAGGTCAAEVRQAKRLPIDLLFVVDKSGSMDLPIGSVGTQWDLLREALLRFVQDPGSAGLGVGLQLFPLVQRTATCTQDTDCEPDLPGLMAPVATHCLPERAHCSGTGRPCATVGQACGAGLNGDVCVQIPRTCRSRGHPQCDGNYTDPLVPVATLPGAQQPFATRLIYTLPSGTTPMGPAVRGGLTHLRQRLQTTPERRPALVLVTDGFPVGCDEQIPEIAEIVADAHRSTPSIATFVIGVFPNGSSTAQTAFDQLATAGGTAPAVIVEPNADLSARFLAALEQIREAALPCEFDIPAPQNGPLDFSRVNLRWQAASSMEELLYVERPDRCDDSRGGWYYDVPPAQGRPTRVLVCPATCRRFRSEPNATVELAFGCQTRTID